MTDHEVFRKVLSCIDPSASEIGVVRRNGRDLLGLSPLPNAAARALGLYQPQRPLARMMAATLRCLARCGLHGRVLPKVSLQISPLILSPPLSGVEAGSCGVLLGSPEHRVRRAIASYRNSETWEVAKFSFGAEGAQVLEQEARTLEELEPLAKGVPRLLGMHQGEGVTVLRMPYLSGRAIGPGRFMEAIDLLVHWISDCPLRPIPQFPEWPSIKAALSVSEAGRRTLDLLSGQLLRPVICHGDFARWNLLKQADGSLMVLDWEWGHPDGMPGIDLVHYFLQDARLVQRLSHQNAVAAAMKEMQHPECRQYLEKTGWGDKPLLAAIACLAYKQGARHQDNGEILQVALEMSQ